MPLPIIPRIKKTKEKFAVLEVSKEGLLKIIYFDQDNQRTKISQIKEVGLIPQGEKKDEDSIIESAFRQIDRGYKDVFICLARMLVTIRCIKLPSQDEQELHNMVKLQATKYLPYKKEEIVVGYQTIKHEPGGYSRLLLILLHKDTIKGYLKAGKDCNINIKGIFASSYGLFNWFLDSASAQESGQTKLILEIDASVIDLIIAEGNNLLFSRAFSFSLQNDNWRQALLENIKVSFESYSRESIGPPPKDIILTGIPRFLPQIKEFIAKETGLSTKIIYPFDIPSCLEGGLKLGTQEQNSSFSHLIGIGLYFLPSQVNLIGQMVKMRIDISLKKREFIKLGIYVCAIIGISFLIIYKDVSAKLRYLKELNTSLQKIAKDAHKLQDMESKLKIVQEQLFTKPTSVDIIYELYKIIPPQIKLESLVSTKEQQIILKGYAYELIDVNRLISILNSSNYFSNVKLDYASKKGEPPNNVAMFRIICPVAAERK